MVNFIFRDIHNNFELSPQIFEVFEPLRFHSLENVEKLEVLRAFLSCRFTPSTVEPRFNEPLNNEVLGITNDFLQPGQNYSKMYATELRNNEPRYNEILLITNTIQNFQNLDITNKCQHVTKDECETEQQEGKSPGNEVGNTILYMSWHGAT